MSFPLRVWLRLLITGSLKGNSNPFRKKSVATEVDRQFNFCSTDCVVMHMIVYLIFTLLQIFAKVQPDYMKEAQEYANDKMLTLTANYSGCDWASRCASLNSSFPVYHCLELKFIKNGGGDDATQGGGEDRGLGTEWGLGSQVQPNWEVPLIMPSSHQLWPSWVMVSIHISWLSADASQAA